MSLQPSFLSLDDVLQIHADQIERYGGLHGIRDTGLLASALAQPMRGVDEEYFHSDLPAMAAAYAFHIVKNHPFLDGNKRAGYAAALTFLTINGYDIELDEELEYSMVLGIAEGKLSKDQIIDWFRARVVE